MQDGEVTVPPGADLGSGDCGSLSSSRVREKRDVTCAKFFAQHVPRVAPRIASEKSEREVLLLLGGGRGQSLLLLLPGTPRQESRPPH